jgi:hypothetical protein
MQAALPPSSSTTGFLPALAFSAQPTPGDPVNESSLNRSSVVNRSAASRLHGRMLNAPGGRSVSASNSPMINAPTGVCDAGLSTKGQPAAMAGAILCAARLIGKLNGEMNEQGPMGTRFHTDSYPSARGEISKGAYSP